MSDSLEFGYGSSTGNNSVFGALKHWVRSKNGVSVGSTYNRGRPRKVVEDSFFSVVWQIKVEKPGKVAKPEWARTIHLQVESPRHHTNSCLNNLKREVVRALLTSELGELLREEGYRYDDTHGRRISDDEDQMKGCITITPLKVLLDESQVMSTPKETINAVHDIVGSSVDAVLQHFVEDLNKCFVGRFDRHPRRVTIIRRRTNEENLPVPDTTVEQRVADQHSSSIRRLHWLP